MTVLQRTHYLMWYNDGKLMQGALSVSVKVAGKRWKSLVVDPTVSDSGADGGAHEAHQYNL